MIVIKQISQERSIEEWWRKGIRPVTQLLILVSVFIGFQVSNAQSVPLTPGLAAPMAIGCAPSANGTGHMVCLEYSAAGRVLTGVSWLAPPASIGALNGKTNVVEAVGTLLPLSLTPQPPVTAVGAPGCGPNHDGGLISCLAVTKDSNGYSLLEVGFYPPMSTNANPPDGAAQQYEMPLVPNPIALTTATAVGTPTCAFAGVVVNNASVLCVVAVNQQLYGIAFSPENQTTTQLVSLGAQLSGVVGNPGCDSVQQTPQTTVWVESARSTTRA